MDNTARQRLMRAMLARVVDVVREVVPPDHICLIGPSLHGQADGLTLLDDPGKGLNTAADVAREQVMRIGASRIVVLFADLPLILPEDVRLLAKASGIVIAADRHGTGTNALSLPLPAARGFAFAFGTGSRARHQAEAERLGLIAETIHSPGLARDIDEPGDLPDAAALL